MRILILGGYGVFGGRLARLLSDAADLELLICGRSLARHWRAIRWVSAICASVIRDAQQSRDAAARFGKSSS